MHQKNISIEEIGPNAKTKQKQKVLTISVVNIIGETYMVIWWNTKSSLDIVWFVKINSPNHEENDFGHD